MGLLDHLWDDTLAGPPPDSGLGKLRKYNTFSFRSNSGKESEAANSVRSFGEDGTEDATKVTRSIMIVKPPLSKDSPPVSPAGSTTPVSPFAGKTSEVCVSPGGRFPPYSNEGKPPKKASKGPKDLTLCRVFRKRTCCDVTQTHPALLSIRKLASSGEANQECLQLWELLECSICDPRVGVQRGPPCICASFCDRVYEACSAAYFAMDAKTQVLAPCGLSDFVCGRASKWVSNGTELCNAAGFSVMPSDDSEEMTCYGGKGSLDYIANSWKTSHSEIIPKEQNTLVLEDFRQWIVDMPFIERISWAVGGMVLTAGGLLFASKRKTYNQRQRTARKLGTKANYVPPVGQGNRKGIGR